MDGGLHQILGDGFAGQQLPGEVGVAGPSHGVVYRGTQTKVDPPRITAAMACPAPR